MNKFLKWLSTHPIPGRGFGPPILNFGIWVGIVLFGLFYLLRRRK